MNKTVAAFLTVENTEGMRLDRWLKIKYPGLTQGIIEKFVRLGKIRIDGKKTTAGTRVLKGHVVEAPAFMDTVTPRLSEPKRKSPSLLSQEDETCLESMILWEDEEILVLNKPFALATQGGTKTYHHLDGLLSAYGKKHGIRYRLVHRLDRDTSGVLVVAKTSDVATFLGQAFRQGTIKKMYWAVVIGQIKPGQGAINAPLLKGGDGNQEKVAVHKAGKMAITNYRTMKSLKRKGVSHFTWAELIPETGRTHQLRVHAMHVGHPILGDGKYGGKMATTTSRQLHLHARSITLPDPSTGTSLTFTSPLPPHMEATLKSFQISEDFYK